MHQNAPFRVKSLFIFRREALRTHPSVDGSSSTLDLSLELLQFDPISRGVCVMLRLAPQVLYTIRWMDVTNGPFWRFHLEKGHGFEQRAPPNFSVLKLHILCIPMHRL